MRILVVHSFYRQLGGEDLSFRAECQLLERYGHDVLRFTLENEALADMSATAAAVRTVWNREAYRQLRQLIQRHRPDVMHCTNLFPLISEAAYWAAHHEGLPVVQALRNYRMLCPAATLFRDGRQCTQCVSRRVAWPVVRHACYRGSRAASATVAVATSVHRMLGSRRAVKVHYTLTEFARQQFVAGGFDPGRIVVKPNFLEPDPGPGLGRSGGAVFVGRLAPEKGIRTMLEAWRRLGTDHTLSVIGDGPLAPLVAEAAAGDSRIRFLGFLPPETALEHIGDASCLIQPSEWYETFGRTIMEAFARGTPVVASNLGAMAELVEHGRTGLLFTAGDAAALAGAAQHLLENPSIASAMRSAARQTYLARYTGEANYQMLMAIYERALAPAKQPEPTAPPARLEAPC